MTKDDERKLTEAEHTEAGAAAHIKNKKEKYSTKSGQREFFRNKDIKD